MLTGEWIMRGYGEQWHLINNIETLQDVRIITQQRFLRNSTDPWGAWASGGFNMVLTKKQFESNRFIPDTHFFPTLLSVVSWWRWQCGFAQSRRVSRTERRAILLYTSKKGRKWEKGGEGGEGGKSAWPFKKGHLRIRQDVTNYPPKLRKLSVVRRPH